MKLFRMQVYLLGISFFSGIVGARELVKDHTRTETEERVNGRLFVHVHESLNGVVTDEWRIEGELVSKKLYEDAFLDGEREELARAREHEEKVVAIRESSKKQIRVSLANRLLAERVKFCRSEIAKLDECNLSRFMAFSSETFVNAADYNQLVLEVLPKAEEALSKADVGSPDLLTPLESELSQYAERLELFVQSTFARASKECNDPKVLKKILELC